MHYTQLFRSLREAKGLTLEGLATRARCHRNTVTNVESGRPVKFKTLARLMVKMGYVQESPEMKALALLWLEDVSGIPFSHPETEAAAHKLLAGRRAAIRWEQQQLEGAVNRANLNAEQIGLLTFATRHPETLAILEQIRDLSARLAQDEDAPSELKIAEDP
ncbi:hypothetical protein MASR2M8_07180 [Opitutaceae bacterium]